MANLLGKVLTLSQNININLDRCMFNIFNDPFNQILCICNDSFSSVIISAYSGKMNSL